MATLSLALQLEKHESIFEFLVEELHHPIYDSKKVMLFVPLSIVSHPVKVPFFHTFAMALYLTPLPNLNVETLFKIPLAIPLSLLICRGWV